MSARLLNIYKLTIEHLFFFKYRFIVKCALPALIKKYFNLITARELNFFFNQALLCCLHSLFFIDIYFINRQRCHDYLPF